MPQNMLSQLFFAAFLCVISQSVFATRITIVDSENKPVENAVISLSGQSGNTSVTPTDIVIMDQSNYQFLPNVLVISKDQWVDFPNSDNVRHHIYSFSSPKPFEIKMFSGSEAEPIQFSKPGIVVLGCNIHDSMVGYIYVSEHEVNKLSNNVGQLEIENNDLANAERDKDNTSLIPATLWHSLLSPTNAKRIDVQIDTNLAEQIIQIDITQSVTKANKKNTSFSSKFKRNN